MRIGLSPRGSALVLGAVVWLWPPDANAGECVRGPDLPPLTASFEEAVGGGFFGGATGESPASFERIVHLRNGEIDDIFFSHEGWENTRGGGVPGAQVEITFSRIYYISSR